MISYADQIRACSEAFQSSMETLSAQGVSYYDDRAAEAAATAIGEFVPDLANMRGERVEIESDLGIAIEGRTTFKYDDVAVSAILNTVRIQELHETIEEDGTIVKLVRHDLIGIFIPEYKEPHPVDLVFGTELVVPFGVITHLDLDKNN